MTTADDIFDRSASNIRRLGLKEIPFTESPIALNCETLGRVFTGREGKLEKVFNLFQGRDRRRILVYGRIGIGKSAFLLEVLSVLRRKRPKMLTAYISLPLDLDLATMDRPRKQWLFLPCSPCFPCLPCSKTTPK
jgi:hypothetical protein